MTRRPRRREPEDEPCGGYRRHRAVGSYLVPRLVAGGHEVIARSRGLRGPYLPSPRWDSATMITVDRAAADADGSFGGQQFRLTT